MQRDPGPLCLVFQPFLSSPCLSWRPPWCLFSLPASSVSLLLSLESQSLTALVSSLTRGLFPDISVHSHLPPSITVPVCLPGSGEGVSESLFGIGASCHECRESHKTQQLRLRALGKPSFTRFSIHLANIYHVPTIHHVEEIGKMLALMQLTF